MIKKLITAVIVEDEEDHLEGLQAWLEELGYVNILGTVGDEYRGYEEIVLKKPDIVFLDIELGKNKKGGFDLMEKIALNGVKTSFIITTGYGDVTMKKDNSKKGYKFDVFDFLEKPYSPEELKDTLLRWIAKKSYAVWGNEKVKFKTQEGVVLIDPMEIACCKTAEGRNRTEITLFLKNDRVFKSVIVFHSLKVVKELLAHFPLIEEYANNFSINVMYVALVNTKTGDIFLSDGPLLGEAEGPNIYKITKNSSSISTFFGNRRTAKNKE